MRRKLQTARSRLKHLRCQAGPSQGIEGHCREAAAPEYLEGSSALDGRLQPSASLQTLSTISAVAPAKPQQRAAACNGPLHVLVSHRDRNQHAELSAQDKFSTSQQQLCGPGRAASPKAGRFDSTCPAAPSSSLFLQDSAGGDEADADSLCIICMEVQADVVFQPCSHNVTCRQCAAKVLAQTCECPMCRCRLQGLVLQPD